MPSLGLSRGVPFYQMRPNGLSFSSFLKNCGGLVGDIGQQGRPLLDNEVLSLNGTDQHARVQPNISDLGDVIITVVAEHTKIDDSVRYLYNLGSNNFRVGVRGASNNLYIGSLEITAVSLPLGEMFTLSIVVSNGNAIEAILNGVLVWSWLYTYGIQFR